MQEDSRFVSSLASLSDCEPKYGIGMRSLGMGIEGCSVEGSCLDVQCTIRYKHFTEESLLRSA